MPINIARLRRWFVAALVLICLAVGGTYLYLRHRVTNALKQVPGKIGIEIQQSADQFTISKSEQGRTIFKLQASKAVQFKQGGRAELHDVTITLYGRDSSRFDQVYGQEFEYDMQSGEVISRGEVSIDLQANPEGILHPDQTTPKELKNPIHLKTSNLIFNKNSGDAWTDSSIEFRTPQASGSAVGVRYVAKDTALTLQSQIKIVMTGTMPGTILADRALLEKAPREIVLTHPHAESPEQQAQADELTLFLNEDNTLERVAAVGAVKIEARQESGPADVGARPSQARAAGATWSQVSARRLDINTKPDATVKDAVLSGDVRFFSEGLKGFSGRATFEFGAHNSVSKVHADGNVKLVQASEQPADRRGRPFDSLPAAGRSGQAPSLQTQSGGAAQDIEITAPAMDFFLANRRLTRAETVGAPQISLTQAKEPPVQPKSGTKTGTASRNAQSTSTLVTAYKFIARFDSLGQLSQVQGGANARVVSSTPPQNGASQPDRVSTSDSIDAFFRPGSGIEALVQQGHFVYRSGSQEAYADSARYTPADQILTLSGSPRVVDAGMATTARNVRLNRATGDGFAEGDVKTSYSDLKPQPNGALLATSDRIHVTAQSMRAHANPALATYTGNARLWQNANVIEAPTILFQKEQRTVIAGSRSAQKVSTVLVGTDKKGTATPVTVTSAGLAYKDSDRKAHFDGGVVVRGSDLTITSQQMDVFLALASAKKLGARGPSPAQSEIIASAPAGGAPVTPQSNPNVQSRTPGPAQLEKIVASGTVVLTEPSRRATGEQLTYTTSDDKFVLTGGPPSIFDAEHGKITAVSLTLFRRDGRVVVEGDSKSPAVTETKVVR